MKFGWELTMAHEIGFKRCGRGHILGRMLQNGRGAEYLELFRLAIDYGEDMPELPDVIAVLPAGFDIRCSVCGEVVDFHQSLRWSGTLQTAGNQENDLVL
jgi:hypothetical protein